MKRSWSYAVPAVLVVLLLVLGPVASLQASVRSAGVPVPIHPTSLSANNTYYLLVAAVVLVAAVAVVATTSSSLTETAATTGAAVVTAAAADQTPAGKNPAQWRHSIAHAEFDH